MLKIGDSFKLIYCPAVSFKLIGVNKKDKTFTFEMLTGFRAGKNFTNRQSDVDKAFKLKDWEQLN